MKQYLFLVLIVFVLCALVHSVSSRENNSLHFKNHNNKFAKRSLLSGLWYAGQYSGAYWRSVSFSGDTPNYEGDYLWGTAFASSNRYPLSWLAYFDTAANVTLYEKFNFMKFNVSLSASFIASSYLQIQELNSTGVVKQVLLNTLKWYYNFTISSELTNTEAGIYAFVFNGYSQYYPTLSIQLQYLVSEYGGTLNLTQDVLLVPKGVETIFVLTGWQYQNPENHLELQLAVGCSSSTWSWETGEIILSNISSINQSSYFRLSKHVVVDGTVLPVSLSAVTGNITLIFPRPVIEQLSSRYSFSAVAWLITVSFPPGATNLVYDPLTVAGDAPLTPEPVVYVNNLSSDNFGLIVGVAVGGVTLVGIVAVIYFSVRRKREGYTKV